MTGGLDTGAPEPPIWSTDDCLLSTRELFRIWTFWVPARRSERGGPVPARLIPGPVRVSTYLDGYTPDGHGLAGPLPTAPNVWMPGGFSGNGFKLASAIGEVAADLIRHGKTSLPIAHLDPGRYLT